MDNYLPPHDVAAEQQVLGAMLLSPTAIDEAGRLLRGRDFYKLGHEWVYDAMVDLAGERQPVDAVTVGEELRRRGHLDKVGGLPYLADLVHAVSVTANVCGTPRSCARRPFCDACWTPPSTSGSRPSRRPGTPPRS